MSKISINEIFGPTIQGEGVWTGCPAIFVRLNGCNLRCVFAGGSICDTPYTSHHAERVEPVEISEAIREIEEKMKGNTITDLVITGGEPLLQKEALGELLREFKNRHKEVKITVETNGSILPTETLSTTSVSGQCPLSSLTRAVSKGRMCRRRRGRCTTRTVITPRPCRSLWPKPMHSSLSSSIPTTRRRKWSMRLWTPW